jgi:uncharacterized protein YjiK
VAARGPHAQEAAVAIVDDAQRHEPQVLGRGRVRVDEHDAVLEGRGLALAARGWQRRGVEGAVDAEVHGADRGEALTRRHHRAEPVEERRRVPAARQRAHARVPLGVEVEVGREGHVREVERRAAEREAGDRSDGRVHGRSVVGARRITGVASVGGARALAAEREPRRDRAESPPHGSRLHPRRPPRAPQRALRVPTVRCDTVASMGKKEKASKKEKVSKKAAKERVTAPRLALTLLEEVALPVRSASAIAPLGAGHALLVDDDEGIYALDPEGDATLLRGHEDARGLGDLESVCASADRKTVYAVSEESGEVFAFRARRVAGRVALSEPKRLGVLPRPGDVENKGWEGASHLGPVAGHGPCLVVAHERDPKALGVFTLPELREVTTISLEDTEVGALLDDVADVAVCPRTDHLFLLSDESHRIVEARLDLGAGALELVGAFDLDLRKKDKPEGIAFESSERLVVVTDDPSRLLRFARGALPAAKRRRPR